MYEEFNRNQSYGAEFRTKHAPPYIVKLAAMRDAKERVPEEYLNEIEFQEFREMGENVCRWRLNHARR